MKILYIAPHLSTGGMPQFLLKKIQLLRNDYNIYCVEYNNISSDYIVQRNKIIDILKDKFYTLSENNKYQLIDIIKHITPDIIHFEELPEYFCNDALATEIYSSNRTYKIFETSHDSGFNINDKRFYPDKILCISEYQRQLFSPLNIPLEIIEYPIEFKTKSDRSIALQELKLDINKFHILNIGLFTPRKNQKEIIQYAKLMCNDSVQFHFVGNTADNFKEYWEPLLMDLPHNCKLWGESHDTNTFYNAMDLFLFTSRGNNTDRETSPLVIRESIGWNMPLLMYNLDVYCGMYNKYSNITFLTDEYDQNVDLIRKHYNIINLPTVIKSPEVNNMFDVRFSPSENKIEFKYNNSISTLLNISIRDIDSKIPIYWISCLFDVKHNYAWCIPLPITYYKFSSNVQFRGFLIEMYDKNNMMVFYKEIIVNDILPNKNIPLLKINNPYDCLFINYNELFIEKKYDCYKLNDLDVVIDIGANSGLFSFFCAQKNSKKIYAIEPNPIALENMKSVLLDYKCVTIFNMAICNKNGRFNLKTEEKNTTIGKIVDEVTDDTISVDGITLEKFIHDNKLQHISLVKMDVEGGEYDIFAQLSPNVFQIIDKFLIEFHNNTSNQVESIINKLIKNEFDIDQIRNHTSCLNENITQTYHNYNNGTIFATKLPKIKIVHLTVKDDIRCEKSIESISKLKQYGFEYVIHINDRFIDSPPTDTCLRPELIPLSLTPSHYGCYKSFKDGVLNEFSDDIDFLMICEGDCIIECSHETFVQTVRDACKIINRESIGYFSFGDTHDVDTGCLQSNNLMVPNEQDLCFITDKIIGIQCILFPKKTKQDLCNQLIYHKWDSADIYFNIIFSEMNLKMGILKSRITKQMDGFSLIDNKKKIFKYRNGVCIEPIDIKSEINEEDVYWFEI